MSGRRSIVVVEDFYREPEAVREWALAQQWYKPYGEWHWMSTQWKGPEDCPFKSSLELIRQLENAVEEKIDLQSWNNPYPLNSDGTAAVDTEVCNSCLWNCTVHVKIDSGQKLGDGIHNHVVDIWNSVGLDGWSGIVYLNENAPIDGGLHLWTNVDVSKNFEWMSNPEDWLKLDQFANIYNRLILVRGSIPHSGANGWGSSIKGGRMFQTFFFKTVAKRDYSVAISRSSLGI